MLTASLRFTYFHWISIIFYRNPCTFMDFIENGFDGLHWTPYNPELCRQSKSPRRPTCAPPTHWHLPKWDFRKHLTLPNHVQTYQPLQPGPLSAEVSLWCAKMACALKVRVRLHSISQPSALRTNSSGYGISSLVGMKKHSVVSSHEGRNFDLWRSRFPYWEQ